MPVSLPLKYIYSDCLLWPAYDCDCHTEAREPLFCLLQKASEKYSSEKLVQLKCMKYSSFLPPLTGRPQKAVENHSEAEAL